MRLHVFRLMPLVVVACIGASLLASPANAARLELVRQGLTAPIGLADPDDGSGILFVQEQHGLVQRLMPDGSLGDPLLDLRPHLLQLRNDFEERGLLGMALHPEFNANGKLYVSYSAPLAPTAPSGWNHTRRISELTLMPGTDTIDLGTERILINLDWPSRKHNGGALAFGPDGYLYIGIGDGGGAHGVGQDTVYSAFNVPANQLYWDKLAQDPKSLFGSILRIDVDHGFPGYAIPLNNPNVGKSGRDEIYAKGFRNPYRMAFDANDSGEFLITATAETLWEAVYLVDAPGNYGWPLMEGRHCINRLEPRNPPDSCPAHDEYGNRLQLPIIEYPNMQVMDPATQVDVTGIGTAVVGARFYRGKALPELRGRAVFADWSAAFERPSGQLFVAQPPASWGDAWPFKKLAELETRIISLAQDADGELYILTSDNFGPFGETGAIYRLLPSQ